MMIRGYETIAANSRRRLRVHSDFGILPQKKIAKNHVITSLIFPLYERNLANVKQLLLRWYFEDRGPHKCVSLYERTNMRSFEAQTWAEQVIN